MVSATSIDHDTLSGLRNRSWDVAVVGAGVIGLAVAWRAAQKGLRVIVLERADIGGGTSRVAAGMIAPVSEAVASERALLALALRSASMYPAFTGELAEASGCDPGFLACGTLLVARDRDEAEALERELRIRRELGLAVERLLPSRARQLEPSLAPAVRLALEAPDDHAVDPRRLCRALSAAVAGCGAELRTGADVLGLDLAGGRLTGLRLAGGERLSAEQVVLAAGVQTQRLLGVPDEIRRALRPVKGQILRLRDPAGPGLLRRILRAPDCYLVPRGDGGYVLGATMEERGFDRTVTAGAVQALLEGGSRLVPGMGELVIEELVAGLRPGTVDNAPLLGAGGLEGVLWATGHYRHGILLAPVTGALLGAQLAGEPLPDELGGLAPELPAFSPERFAGRGARAGDTESRPSQPRGAAPAALVPGSVP